MKNIAFALAITLGASTSAFAEGHSTSIADGMIACNSEYAACLKGGTDTTIASTPADGVSAMQSNAANWSACNSAQLACYQSLN